MICLQHLQQVEMTTSFILYYNMMWILKKMCPILAVDLCCYFQNRKALDNIDLNLVSHRYVSGFLKDDHFVSARSLASDPSPRGLFQP